MSTRLRHRRLRHDRLKTGVAVALFIVVVLGWLALLFWLSGGGR